MQVTETLSQGLKREYKVVLEASTLAERLNGQLAEMKSKARINGFRPGKVPVEHLRKLYGKSIMGEVVQKAVDEANQKIVADHGLRLAMEPKIGFPGDQAEVERVLEAKGDLAFTINLETLPKFETGTFEDIELERLVAEIPDSEVESGLERLANRNRAYAAKEGDAPAAHKGDRVTIDFTGKIGGEPFEGGTGADIEVVLGSDSFIPGFEEQLEGIKQGEHRVLTCRFPDAYASPKLAGQEATFDVTAKMVAAPGELSMDEEFAKGFGFEGMDDLRKALKENLSRENGKASREKIKRALLDALDKKYSFELPEGLVEMEFSNIWNQVEAEHKQSGRTWEQDDTTEEASRAEYRRIAERRVRLGLVLAEVGDQSGTKVTDEEVTRALVERARAYPGQEKMVWDHYRKNPEALAEIRAPLFEEKVIDHLLTLAKVTERVVPKEELLKVEDEA